MESGDNSRAIERCPHLIRKHAAAICPSRGRCRSVSPYPRFTAAACPVVALSNYRKRWAGTLHATLLASVALRC